VPFTLDSIGGMFFPGTLRVGTLYEKYRETRPVVPHVTLSWQPPAPEEGEADEVESDTGEPHAHAGNVESAEGGDAEAADADTVAVAAAMGEHGATPEKVDLGTLSAMAPLEHEGYVLMIENPYEGSVLSYRHDPGVTPLYIAITAFLIGLVIRTYWPSYRVQLWADAGGRARLTFRATGMLGEPEVVEDELVAALGAEEAAPTPPKSG
jgi:hypothetical protein